MLKWGHGEMLYALLLLAPVAALLLALLKRRRRAIHRLVAAEALPTLAPAWNPARARSRLALGLAALVFLIVALARPQWGFHWEEVRRKGLDLMIVLDTSRSMLAASCRAKAGSPICPRPGARPCGPAAGWFWSNVAARSARRSTTSSRAITRTARRLRPTRPSNR